MFKHVKKCPRCGADNPDDAHLCVNCHYPLPYSPSNLTCPRCGHVNPPSASSCEVCHYPFRISFFIPPPQKDDIIPALMRLERGALSLAVSILTFSVASLDLGSLIGGLLLLISVGFLGAGSSYYSVGFRFLSQRYRYPAILSSFLLPGFILLAIGASEVAGQVPQTMISSLAKNPLAVVLIDVGFFLFVSGVIGITLGSYRLRTFLGNATLSWASLMFLAGAILLLFLPQLSFLALAGQLIIYGEIKREIRSHLRSHP